MFGLTASLAYGEVGSQDIQYPWGHDFIISVQIYNNERADETGLMARLNYDFREINIKGLAAGFAYADLDTPENGATASADRAEMNFDLTYKFSDSLEGMGLRARYAIIDEDESLGGEDFTDFRLQFSYDFSI